VKALAAACAALVLALPLAGTAAASEAHPTLAELEGEVMCPICHTTLDQSNSAAAARIKAFIVRRIRAGDTKSAIKRELVDQFGPAILAEPPKHGFDLLAWLLPIVGILGGALVLGFAAWRWSRRRGPEPELVLSGGGAALPRPLDPELERRLDDELRRFDE
jgi:cytochrome c-type biogenesis protein CcmH